MNLNGALSKLMLNPGESAHDGLNCEVLLNMINCARLCTYLQIWIRSRCGLCVRRYQSLYWHYADLSPTYTAQVTRLEVVMLIKKRQFGGPAKGKWEDYIQRGCLQSYGALWSRPASTLARRSARSNLADSDSHHGLKHKVDTPS